MTLSCVISTSGSGAEASADVVVAATVVSTATSSEGDSATAVSSAESLPQAAKASPAATTKVRLDHRRVTLRTGVGTLVNGSVVRGAVSFTWGCSVMARELTDRLL